MKRDEERQQTHLQTLLDVAVAPGLVKAPFGVAQSVIHVCGKVIT